MQKLFLLAEGSCNDGVLSDFSSSVLLLSKNRGHGHCVPKTSIFERIQIWEMKRILCGIS